MLWVIEPTDKTTAEQLQKKIASKMDVAKVFGGVVTLAMGIVLNLLADSQKVAALPHRAAAYFAAAALATALVLYVSTLYAYDSLLMPTRFWATKVAARRRRLSVIERPPSSANLVLQQNMINIGCGSSEVSWLRCEDESVAVSGAVDAFVLAAEVEAPVVLEVAAGDQGAEFQDGLGAF